MWRGQSINNLVFGVADFVINHLFKIKEFFSMVTNNMFPYIFVFLLGCQTRLGCQSESRFHFVGFFVIFFHVGKSLACHSPAKWFLCA